MWWSSRSENTEKSNLQQLILQCSQQTFQRFFNIVFWLMRRRDVGQCQINVETTLCISTLKQRCHFQRRVFQRW